MLRAGPGGRAGPIVQPRPTPTRAPTSVAAFAFPVLAHRRSGTAATVRLFKWDDIVDDTLVEGLNAPSGWVKEMGIVILTASPDEVTCAWEVAEKHLQPYGIVHGGVHCGVIETVASIGATLVAKPRGQRVVGLENSTTFIRAVRSGRLHGVARPVTRGRSSQVWEAWIRDDESRLVAQGRVRLLCVDENKALG